MFFFLLALTRVANDKYARKPAKPGLQLQILNVQIYIAGDPVLED